MFKHAENKYLNDKRESFWSTISEVKIDNWNCLAWTLKLN